jgi:BMFP domain-containing protein YqiC
MNHQRTMLLSYRRRREDLAKRIMQLHSRIAYLCGLTLRVKGMSKITFELVEIRKELSEPFELVRLRR